MDKELDTKSTKDKLVSFYNNNKIKLFIFLILIFIFLAFLIYFENQNNKQNKIIAEKYITAGLFLSSGDKKESKKIYEEIILSKNRFYSILALNKILENELEDDQNKILSYFGILEVLNDKNGEDYEVIIFKKALFLIKNSKKEEGIELLKKLSQTNSKLSELAKEILEE